MSYKIKDEKFGFLHPFAFLLPINAEHVRRTTCLTEISKTLASSSLCNEKFKLPSVDHDTQMAIFNDKIEILF